MIGEGQVRPIDFYRDYIAHGVLKDSKGNVVSTRVTRQQLNKYKDDYHVEFEHVPVESIHPPVVYGSIIRENIPFDSSPVQGHQQFTVLRYHIVFRHSGLPLGIPEWQEIALGLIANLNDWHQLDQYTAAFLVLEGDGQHEANPFAVMLQQHNNLRTYLIGGGMSLPLDGRVVIDIAKRSNELYPHTPGRTEYRAVAMPDPEGMYFLLTGEKKPLLTGYDITESNQEVEYILDFLPPDDAFYTFKGFLGKRRRISGRSGSPGAEYNTLPQLKPMALQLFSGYWRDNHTGDVKRLESTIISKGDYVGFARLQGVEFYQNWKHIQQSAENTFP
jgi:hypothetical protein